MSDSHLPDDVSQWPSDPFALLGVNRRDDERALRAAYVRLIRRFKPEQNPEAFRRIRDAYEFLRERVGYWQYFEGEDGAAEEATAGEQEPEQHSEALPAADKAAAPVEEPSPPVVRVDPAVEAWQAAEAGAPAKAYARLVTLNSRQPGDETTYVRLYWLLRLAPEIAPQVDRCEWLRRAICNNAAAWMTMHLYGRELETDAAFAERVRPDRLFGPNMPLDEAQGLLTARWRGLLLAQKWQPIAGDVESLRGHFETNRPAWLRLLLTAIGQLAWVPHGEARQSVARWNEEIDQHGEEHAALDYALDRRDYLMALVLQVTELLQRKVLPQELATRLRPVLGQLWNASGYDASRVLIGYLAQILVDHVEALRLWTRATRVARLVVDYLADQVTSLYFDRFGSRDDNQTMKLMVAFRRSLGHCHWADYDNCRLELLAFCLTEHVALAELTALLPQVLVASELSGSGIEAHLAADRALQLVTAGMRIVETA